MRRGARVVGRDYQGADRRGRLGEHFTGMRFSTTAAQALVVVVGMMLPAAVTLAADLSVTVAAQLADLVAGLLAVGAGVALLVAWRIRGLALPGYFGVALIDFGLFTLTADRLIGVAPPPDGTAVHALLTAGLVGLVTGVGLRSQDVRAGMSPLRLLGWTALGGLCLLGGTSVLLLRAPSEFALALGRDHSWIMAGTAAAWVGTAALATRRDRRQPLPRWVPTVLVLLGATAAMRAVPGVTLGAAGLAAAMLTLFALALALTSAAAELRLLLTAQDTSAFRLRSDLAGLRAQMERERGELEERLHDLRNAVGAVRSADTLLRSRADRLDAETRASLADGISAELARLQVLIEPARRAAPVDVDLAEALGPVIQAERAHGSEILADLGDRRVHADPDTLAQLVQNLLVNARRHAPGSPVSITASPGAPGRICLRVADSGPGVAPSESERIFDRGHRGSTTTSHGSGLGLYVARRLAGDLGGSLVLEIPPGPPGSAGSTLPATWLRGMTSRPPSPDTSGHPVAEGSRLPHCCSANRGACFLLDLPLAEPTADRSAKARRSTGLQRPALERTLPSAS